jgi:hypothetical protein
MGMAAEWFYTTNRQQMGPVSWSELRDLAESGILKPHDLVWREGMADWIKAINQEGLFADGAEAEANPAAYAETKPPPGRRTRSRADEVDDDDEQPRRVRKRRRERNEGMGVGVKIGLILGGIVGLLFLLGCAGGVLIWIAISVGGGGEGKRQEYTINNLQEGNRHERQFNFRKGQRVVITVDSTVAHPACDVDLFVIRGPNDIIASDQRMEKDCRVDFVAPSTGNYTVSVLNLGPGLAQTCRVTITER